MNKHAPSLQKYFQTIYPIVVPMLFKSMLECTSTICLKVVFRTRDIFRWGFPDSPLQYRCYIQAVIVFQSFFSRNTPNKLVCIISGRYTFVISVACISSSFLCLSLPPWFVYLLKILCMCRWHMIIDGEAARDNGLKS